MTIRLNISMYDEPKFYLAIYGLRGSTFQQNEKEILRKVYDNYVDWLLGGGGGQLKTFRYGGVNPIFMG